MISTYMCEPPLCRALPEQGLGLSLRFRQQQPLRAEAIVVLLTCPACLTFPGLLVPVGSEPDPPALFAIPCFLETCFWIKVPESGLGIWEGIFSPDYY